MSVHSRSVTDRPKTSHLYELLANWPPPRRSDAVDRQSQVTAYLDELLAVPHVQRATNITIRRRSVA